MAKRPQKFEFHPAATIEAKQAIDWYAEKSETAAADFREELRNAEKRVVRSPQLWGPYLHGTRCFKLRRFPFGLVYIEHGERIIGLAVAHLHRRPGYWLNRIDDHTSGQ